MRENDSPAFRETDPGLALPPFGHPARGLSIKGYGDAGKILSKCDNLQPGNRSCQVYWRPRLPKRLNLLYAIEAFRRPKARSLRRRPEQIHQRLDIVRYQRLLIARVEFPELGNGFGIVNDHQCQNIFLAGNTAFGMAALTVIMGSFTTWLIRSFMATLQSR